MAAGGGTGLIEISVVPMAKRDYLSPASSGGAGPRLEWLIASYYLSHMLCDKSGKGMFGGRITNVALQRKNSGAEVDDILVNYQNHTGSHYLYIQSKRQISVGLRDSDFRQVVIAIQHPFTNANTEALLELTRKAGHEPDASTFWVTKRSARENNVLSVIEGILAIPRDAVFHAFLRQLDFLVFDLGETGADRNKCINDLQELGLASGTPATVLSVLYDLASECSAHGGQITVDTLLEKLAGRGVHTPSRTRLLDRITRSLSE